MTYVCTLNYCDYYGVLLGGDYCLEVNSYNKTPSITLSTKIYPNNGKLL